MSRDGQPRNGVLFWRTFLLIACVAWCCLTGGRASWATSGGVVSLPAAGKGAKTSPTGLTLQVDTRWVDGYGYRPIRVTVASPTPTTADQTITIRFKAGGRSETPDLSVDQDIELPAGSKTVSATVSVPQFAPWNRVWWDCLVDGEFDEALSLEPFSNLNRGFATMGLASGSGLPRVLFVGSGTPRSPGGPTSKPILKSLEDALSKLKVDGRGMGQLRGTIDDAISINISGGAVSVTNEFAQLMSDSSATRSIGDLPVRWIDYSAIDIVCLDRDDLLEVQTSQSAAFSALLQWVSAGGNLWIYGLDDEWGDLTDIESAIGATADERSSDQTVSDRGWQPLGSFRLSSAALEDSLNEYSPDTPFDLRRMVTRSANRVLWTRFKMGSLLISQQALGGVDDVQAVLSSVPTFGQTHWIRRHGLEPDTANLDFTNWLIPGVGLAPVTEFRVLITLFFLLIGPVNYWFLKRRGSLHLLVLTVPLAAIAITLALFGYALVADGLGTRVRARSLTLLDQSNGTAVCWSRLSFYAGLAPSGGLAFSDNVAVYPIPSGHTSGFGYYVESKIPSRSMQWAGEQYLTEGWLNSRTPTQYLTVAARPTGHRLDLVPNAKGGFDVTNGLGAEIELLIVRSADGALYWCESVEADGSGHLEAVPEPEAVRELRVIFADNDPAFPLGLDVASGYGRRSYGRRRRFTNRAEGAQLSRGYLEQRLSEVISPDGDPNRAIKIDNGGYLAITKTGPEVEMGVSRYSEEASFHVIVGKW